MLEQFNIDIGEKVELAIKKPPYVCPQSSCFLQPRSNEKRQWCRKIMCLLAILLVLIIIFAIQYHYSSPKTNNNNNHIKPPIATTTNNIVTTNTENETPTFLFDIFYSFHKYKSQYLGITNNTYNDFKYDYKSGFTSLSDCTDKTINKLTISYEIIQLFLIQLISPLTSAYTNTYVDTNTSYADSSNNKTNFFQEFDISGSFGGGFQIYCNDSLLINADGSIKFIDNKNGVFPGYLDIDDLIDMGLLSNSPKNDNLLRKMQYLNGNGLVALNIGNIEFYKNDVKAMMNEYNLSANDSVISIGGHFNQSSFVDIGKTIVDWKMNNNNKYYNEFLSLMIDEMRMCNDNVFITGYGGGSASNQCEFSDILGNAYFYDFFVSNSNSH